MSYSYGVRSSERLATLDPRLEVVLRDALALQVRDITIICGHRDKVAQNEAFAAGLSKKQWPDSKHNSFPSCAVDIAPWIHGTINWKDEGSFYGLWGVIMSASSLAGIPVRCGCDWDGDGLTEDQTFMDIGHYELVL